MDDSAVEKRKAVTVELLERERDGVTSAPYFVLDQLIENHHPDLGLARFAIAWRLSEVREDADGLMEFGRVKRGADLDRALAPYDFVFIIAHEVWNRAAMNEARQEAILDWLCCHCMPVMKDGEQVVDEKERLCWRLRKPLKVFAENVGRYGLWNAEKVDEAVKRHNDSKRPLLNGAAAKKAAKFSEPALPKTDVV